MEKSTLVIVPGPAQADQLRHDLAFLKDKAPQVLTMAKFVSTQLEKISKGQAQEFTITRKSQLLLQLSVVWKKYFLDSTHQNPNLFFTAYDIFSDLRSFSLDLNTMSDVLKEYGPVLEKAVKIFWLTVDQLGIVDEHAAYQLVSKNCASFDDNEQLIFAEFSHLSGVQVDMLKALAEEKEIIIPLAQGIFKQMRSSDWPVWCGAQLELDSENEWSREKIKTNITRFSKGQLGLVLKKYQETNQEFKALFIPKKNLTASDINCIPSDNHFFKIGSDFFTVNALKADKKINQFIQSQVTTDDLLTFIAQEKNKSLDLARKEGDFRAFKVWQLWKETVLGWSELSDENKVCTHFDVQIFSQIIKLNLPRVSTLSLVTEESQAQLMGVMELSINSSRPCHICFSSLWPMSSKSSGNYPSQVSLALHALGPIRRAGFEFLMVKEKILGNLSHPKSRLFLEMNLEKEDNGVAEILDCLDIEVIEEIHVANNHKQVDTLQQIIQEKSVDRSSLTFSATKIQTYKDCPRQYYFKYLDERMIRPEQEEELAAFELGDIEHAVIASVCSEFDNNNGWDEVRFLAIVNREIKKMVALKKQELPAFSYKVALQEVCQYTRPAIQFLLQLKSLEGLKDLSFEVSIGKNDQSNHIQLDQGEMITLQGRIDCLLNFEDGHIVLDFKRNAIPTGADLSQFKKIQMPLYLRSSQRMLSTPLMLWGHLSLSDLSNSSVIWAPQIHNDLLKSQIDTILSTFDINVASRFPSQDFLTKLDNQLVEVISCALNDQDFYPNPSDESVCNFCSYRSICPQMMGI